MLILVLWEHVKVILLRSQFTMSAIVKKKIVVLLRELARFCFFSPMNYSFWAIFLFGLADVLVVWHLLLDKIGFVIFLSLIVGLLDFEWAPFSE